MRRLAMLTFAAAAACKPPPEAPEGLNESASYLVREFFSDDATFQAGVQGFIAWYESEGVSLQEEEMSLENTGAFQLEPLVADDVAGLPLDAQIVVDKPASGDVVEDRDVSAAAGVVSLAEMDCSVQEAEELLIRPDQDVVFCTDWQTYARSYDSDEAVFAAAWDDGRFANVRAPIDPFGAGMDENLDTTLMFTTNDVDPTPVLGGLADIEEYNMDLVFRHGTYEVDGEPVDAALILTFLRAAAWGQAGTNALLQSYSVEVNVRRPNGDTLRMLTVWAEPKGGGIAPDSPLALNFALKKAKASSDRMSAICAGDIALSKETCE